MKLKRGDKAIPINVKHFLSDTANNVIEYMYDGVAVPLPRTCDVVDANASHVVLSYEDKFFVMRRSQVQLVSVEAPKPAPEEKKPVIEEKDDLKPRPGLKRRLSNVVLLKGSKRPAVMLLQQAFNTVEYDLRSDGDFGDKTDKVARDYQAKKKLHVDGEIGGGTWPVLLNEAYGKGFNPDLMIRIMEMVAWNEVSNHRNVYGMAEDEIRDKNGVPDGAGANFGLAQHNRKGSMETLLRMSSRTDLLQKYHTTDKTVVNEDIQEWMGSPQGIQYQNEYFKIKIYEPAFDYIPTLGLEGWKDDPQLYPYWERLVAMLCDSRVQSGGFFSRHRPFWKTLEPEYKNDARYRELYYGKGWDALLGEHIKYSELKVAWFSKMSSLEESDNHAPKTNKQLMRQLLKLIPDPETKLVLLAQWHSRSCSSRWWKKVESRRMLIATDNGKVNGASLRLYEHFGIGIDR